MMAWILQHNIQAMWANFMTNNETNILTKIHDINILPLIVILHLYSGREQQRYMQSELIESSHIILLDVDASFIRASS